MLLKKRPLWAPKTRDYMFSIITEKFGDYNSWGASTPPDKVAYRKFCKSFAKTIGAKSYKAIEVQVRWAVTTQPNIKNTSTFFECKTAALKAGFIGMDRMPKTMVCEY